MSDLKIYRELAARTNGACMLGVVGPVRTGKSTFIKRFMECLVIPRIENDYARQRARDELPQSGSGRSIMTAEPKFVPEDAVSISLGEDSALSVRLVDCVGYMVEGASGQMEDGEERLVTTPWFDTEVPLSQAAEKGTAKVISEHATIGIVVTTDGSICDLPRSAYLEPERRVIQELKTLGKPFVVLLNCIEPDSEEARKLAANLSEQYNISVQCVNCLRLGEKELIDILRLALEEFPFQSMGFCLPGWFQALAPDDPIKQNLYKAIRDAGEGMHKQRDRYRLLKQIQTSELVESVQMSGEDLGKGESTVCVNVPRTLYYRLLSERSGQEITGDADLLRTLSEMSGIKRDYDLLRNALEQVRSTGYGVVLPRPDQMELEEPQIVRQGGKYSVKLKIFSAFFCRALTEMSTGSGNPTSSESRSTNLRRRA